MDFFTVFHNMFLVRETTDQKYWSHHLNTPEQNNWYGLAFERICMYHIEQIKNAMGIGAISAEYFSWRSAESEPACQIDLLIERADRVINVCEMKFCDGVYMIQKSEDMRIRNRIAAYREETNTRCSVLPVLVTTYGLQKNMYSDYMRSVVVMDDLFKES